jgi:hypothetical protein
VGKSRAAPEARFTRAGLESRPHIKTSRARLRPLGAPASRRHSLAKTACFHFFRRWAGETPALPVASFPAYIIDKVCAQSEDCRLIKQRLLRRIIHECLSKHHVPRLSHLHYNRLCPGSAQFTSDNPFFKESTLPYQAPPLRWAWLHWALPK